MTKLIALIAIGLLPATYAETQKEPKPTEAEKAQALQKHQTGSNKIADDQDKLSADVQELIIEQTNPKVIELLSKVETLMAENVDRHEDGDTSGDTIALETEIIEMIYEAAKAKSQ